MHRPSFVLTVAGICLGTTGAAQTRLPFPEQYRLRVEYRQFHSKLTGQLQHGFGEAAGTDLDVRGDLGIGDKKTWSGLAVLQLKPGHKLRGSITRLDYDGDLAAGRSFVYGETTFVAGNRVVTSLKGNYFTGEYEWDFVQRNWGFLGLLIGAKFVDVDGVIVAEAQPVREVETLRAPIPVAGLAGRAYFGSVSLGGEVSGLVIGERGQVYEIDGTARIHFSDRLAVGAGYRLLSLTGEKAPDRVDLRLQGWTWGVELSL